MGTCLNCGGQLTVSGRGRPQTKFCSGQCKEAVRTARRRASIDADLANRQCVVCGTTMLGHRSRKAKCCSPECSIKHQNDVRAEKKRAQKIATRKPCEFCDGQIPDARRGDSKFCSPECKKKAMAAYYRQRMPGYMRQYLYGVTEDQYDALLVAQGNACAICRSTAWPGKHRRPYVDHDHRTGTVRGLLCGKCNFAIGQLDDDPARLRAAIAYLEAHINN